MRFAHKINYKILIVLMPKEAKQNNKENEIQTSKEKRRVLTKMNQSQALLESHARNILFQVSDNPQDQQFKQFSIKKIIQLNIQKPQKKIFEKGFSPWNMKQHRESGLQKIQINKEKRQKLTKQQQNDLRPNSIETSLDQNCQRLKIPRISKSISRQQIPQIIKSNSMKRYPSRQLSKIDYSRQEIKSLMNPINYCDKSSDQRMLQQTQIVTIMHRKKSLPNQTKKTDLLKVLSDKQITVLNYMKYYSKIYETEKQQDLRNKPSKNVQGCSYDQQVFAKRQNIISMNDHWKNKNKPQKVHKVEAKEVKSSPLTKCGQSNTILKSFNHEIRLINNPKQILKFSKRQKVPKKITEQYSSSNPLTKLLYEKYLHTINVGSWGSRDNHNANIERSHFI